MPVTGKGEEEESDLESVCNYYSCQRCGTKVSDRVVASAEERLKTQIENTYNNNVEGEVMTLFYLFTRETTRRYSGEYFNWAKFYGKRQHLE